MGTLTKLPLSGKTNSMPIVIDDDTTPGVTIHTATSSTDVIDEVYLWVWNVGGVALTLTLVFDDGGTPLEIPHAIPAESGPYAIYPGIAEGEGLVISAFCPEDDSGVLVVNGYVNRMDHN